MSSNRKFYRTTLVYEVLSEEPYQFEGLNTLAYDVYEGHNSGMLVSENREEVDGPTAARLLQAQGSDPEFFMLTPEGDDTEDAEDFYGEVS
jgi:hypothetical protein